MSEKICQNLPRRPSSPPPKSEKRPWSRPTPPREPSRSPPRMPRERLQMPPAAQEGAESLPEPPAGRPRGHFGTFSAPFRQVLEPFGNTFPALFLPLPLASGVGLCVCLVVGVLLSASPRAASGAFYSVFLFAPFWCPIQRQKRQRNNERTRARVCSAGPQTWVGGTPEGFTIYI